MVNDKYIALVEKLIKMSKKNALSWKYLDTESDLCDGMDWKVTPTAVFALLGDLSDTVYFDGENSFVCRRDGTYLVLFMEASSTTPSLYVVPHTYKGVVVLKPGEYGEYTTRLFNIVKSSFPHADSFIDKFLSEE